MQTWRPHSCSRMGGDGRAACRCTCFHHKQAPAYQCPSLPPAAAVKRAAPLPILIVIAHRVGTPRALPAGHRQYVRSQRPASVALLPPER